MSLLSLERQLYFPRRAIAPLLVVLLSTLSASCANISKKAVLSTEASSGALFDELAALDSAVFAAFNTCIKPDQLARHAGFFADDVEFYHDKGGVTWNRAEMLANTQKYVCGNFRRELLPGSLRVYPIKDFGAITQGAHRFCQFASGQCEGAAEFLMVWQKDGQQWRITRVLSYGHRPI